MNWLKRLFSSKNLIVSCKHDWEVMGEHFNHPAFEYKGKITFIKCRLCDWRRIEY